MINSLPSPNHFSAYLDIIPSSRQQWMKLCSCENFDGSPQSYIRLLVLLIPAVADCGGCAV